LFFDSPKEASMADAPEIKVKLTAEDTGVAAAIKELGAQLKSLKKQQDDVASSAGGLADAFKGLLGAIAVEQLLSFSKGVLDAGVSIARTSQITGASTQTLGVFRKTADDLGVSSEAVDKGFVKLSKSILSFQQGGSQARQAFALLNISQKDFAGLNTDQKIKLVTDRLGGMADGTQKAAIAQLLLGRGGAELIPVLNELAGEGFEKARAEAEKFGLLLDSQTERSLVLLKKSLTDVEDAGKGVATQFTAGIAPALTDMANAIVKVTTNDGVAGFRELGKEVGNIFKDIALVVVGFTDTIIRNFAKVEEDVRNIGRAIGDVFKVGFSAANKNLAANIKESYALIDTTLDQAEKSIFEEFNGATREKESKPPKPPAAPPKAPVDEVAALAALKRQEQEEALAKSQAALLQRQLQDEIEIFKANAQQREQIEKNLYDQSELSTAEYYARRKADLQTETEKELAILQAQLTAERAELQRQQQEKTTNAAKARQFGQASPVGQQYAAASIKNNEAALASLSRIDDLQTKIDTTKINAATKALALDQQKSKADDQSQQETLDFERQLAELQGKRQDSARAEIEVEAKKRSDQIAQAGGGAATQARLKAELEQWKQLKLAVADYDDARKKTEEDTKAFEIAKQAIELNQKSGKVSPLEAEREINQLIKDRLPLLKADADAELGAAKKTGNQDNIAQSQQQKAQIENLTISAEKLGNTLGQSVAGDFTTFFETVGRGTQSVAKSFQKLAASVIQSVEQMLIKLLLLQIAQKASGTAFGQSSFGSAFLSGFQGHAEGGLIKGPGGPKSDSIPARLSAGEFVMKADAVQRFGVSGLEAINRGMNPQPFANLQFPKFSEGGLVGSPGAPGASGAVHLGIALDKGLILQHLSSKDAGRIILDHISNNPKAASKALGRSQG
jgi:hypothetical protein